MTKETFIDSQGIQAAPLTELTNNSDVEAPLVENEKTRWERLRPALACGAGLFSDGYLQAVIGPVNTILSKL